MMDVQTSAQFKQIITVRRLQVLLPLMAHQHLSILLHAPILVTFLSLFQEQGNHLSPILLH